MAEKATISLETGTDPLADALTLGVVFHDSALTGHDAQAQIIANVDVQDSSPVHKEHVIYRKAFKVTRESTFEIPRAKIRAYSYTGKQIHLEIHVRIVVDDSIFIDTKIQEEQLLELGLKAPVQTNANTLVEPPDDFLFFRNLKAIPLHNQVLTLSLAVVGGFIVLINMAVGVHDQFVPESMTWLYSHYSSDGESSSPLAGALAGSGALGAGVWFMIRNQLRKYMKFHLRSLKSRIVPDRSVPVSSLFQGKSRVSLENVTLTVVASNMEKGQYIRGSGSNRRTVSFSNPVRGVVLYKQTVASIPPRVQLGQYFPGDVEFDKMFATLYPPFMIGKTHGLDIHWEIQLLHPEFVDQELVGPTGLFHYEHFLRD